MNTHIYSTYLQVFCYKILEAYLNSLNSLSDGELLAQIAK